MSTQAGAATSKHHQVVIPDAASTQMSFPMTVVEGVLKFIVTIFSFATAQRKMEWVQSQLQIALDRVDQIEDQIQAQNAFARGFIAGILATFVVFAAPLLVAIFGMMVWMIAHWH